jgi:hypothetical protein
LKYLLVAILVLGFNGVLGGVMVGICIAGIMTGKIK